ncbi:MAG: MarR family transcriptional regulator [Methanobacterium sp.]|uniref:MarR family winged helix-turn-helix transcriptional regulator n=1 Tax=Methanobacterium sp. TaxID=2164 RepID=UPI003D6591D4|nr:MarR family transcriptional regulator [Methanobacterium sp.]
MSVYVVFDENDIEWASFKLRYLVKRKLQNKLKKHNISLDQWIILSIIYQSEGSNQKKLAELAHRDRAAITRILNILEYKELIDRKNSYHDRREFLIYLTDKGKDLYEETSKIMSQNAQEIKSIFSKSELEQFNSLLNKLSSNLE